LRISTKYFVANMEITRSSLVLVREAFIHLRIICWFQICCTCLS
ncbi:hypothetical protein LCGC14_2032360, partial [marine sediment metagenome]